ncbi:PEP-CTERM sorting domain-containing protein [Luteolibacter marinus]|uniref:PEP-CTERM sorting domain-containing protein n=1 Tax=Luteolibacter marinus TaxID=2776705 RepID=UPI0018674EE2|nr:PEP-CTERM sorting domain-containing protein [Luteolibacter marinus]
MKLPLPLLSLAAALSSVASATVVNIDFGTSESFTGLAAAPDPENSSAMWNYMASVAGTASSLDLNDSAGNSTGIEFSISGVANENQTSGNGDLAAGIGLMRDYLRIDSGSSTSPVSVTGQFSGLVVGGTYDLYLFGQGQYMAPSGGTNRGQNSLFTVNGTSKQTGWDGVVGGNGLFEESTSLLNQGEYVKFTVVAVDGGGSLGGVISFDFANVVPGGASPNPVDDFADNGSGGGSRYGALNGIQLVSVVPEPSSMFLGALGMLSLALRRRR